MKILAAALAVGSLVAMTGCLQFPTAGYPAGLLYTGVSAPDQALDRVDTGGAGKTDDKEGKVCANGVLGLVAWGDASLDAAKKAGGITELHSVEHSTMSILGLFIQGCTIAHGK
jgi:hypothetical protein